MKLLDFLDRNMEFITILVAIAFIALIGLR